MSSIGKWKDFESLLKPISISDPSGVSIRYDACYDEIKEARRQEDARLPQGVWQRDVKYSDWSKVEKLCTVVLQEKSKDLQVAAWLTESWLHEKGIKGLGYGIQYLNALCDCFWDSLHPQIDNDGADYRLSPINWLNEKLPEQLALYAISNPEIEGSPVYSLAEYDFILNTGYKASASKKTDQKEMTHDAIQASIKSTPNYFYELLYKDSLLAISVLEEFETFLAKKLPSESISLYQLRNTLGKFRDCMLGVLRERDLLGNKKTLVLNTPEESESLDMKDELTPINQPAPFEGTFETREQAYALIAQIAQYLESVEPHSPTPYLLKKAITWGNLPLSALIQEFIQNNMDFIQLQKWLSIPTPGMDEKEITRQQQSRQ